MGQARWQVDDAPNGVRTLTLCNAAKRNALDGALLEQLAQAIDPATTRQVRAFLLQGEGRQAFCSGYDLTQLMAVSEGQPLPDERLGEVLGGLAAHPAPSVALVHGAAFGAGCELAAACDFRVGSPGVRFCMPPARLGVVYAPAGVWRLAQMVGVNAAKRLFFTGRAFDGAESHRMGLLDELCADEAGAEQGAQGLAEVLASNAPLALRGMKRTFTLLTALPLGEAAQTELEGLRREAFTSQDLQEGRAAFLEKRSPMFRGR